MSYLSQPPETVADFVPEVCPCGEDSKALVLQPKCARERGCTRDQDIFDPGPR